MEPRVLRNIKITVNEGEVLRYQGYRKQQPVSGAVRDVLNREIKEGYQLIAPSAVYNQIDVSRIGNGMIELVNGSILHLGAFVSDFKGAISVSIAVCTIGPALEERVAELFSQEEFAEALMLDSVGSVAADAVADAVNYRICQQARKLKMQVGTRFSPGYGKWDVSEQKVLFQLCDASAIGVSLNEAYMMKPKKSVSFCVGIGQQSVGSHGVNRCRRCNMEKCRYRNEEGNE
ncbi:MAG: vitamin B12 dependent-methionine synthase activation domain-containing protein [Chloroflexota bacterium]